MLLAYMWYVVQVERSHLSLDVNPLETSELEEEERLLLTGGDRVQYLLRTPRLLRRQLELLFLLQLQHGVTYK